MNITLNGNRLDFQLENEKTVGEVLGKIEEACRKEKSTINEVRVNGKAVSGWCRARAAAVTVSMFTGSLHAGSTGFLPKRKT